MVPVMIAVAAVFFVSLLALALLGLWLPLPLLAVVLFAFGFCGSFNVVLLAQVRLLFPPHMTGRALTAVNMLGFMGTALIQWLMGVIISAFAPDMQGHYPAAAYTAAFLFTAIGTGLALVWYRYTAEGAAPGCSRNHIGRKPSHYATMLSTMALKDGVDHYCCRCVAGLVGSFSYGVAAPTAIRHQADGSAELVDAPERYA